MNSPRSLSCRL